MKLYVRVFVWSSNIASLNSYPVSSIHRHIADMIHGHCKESTSPKYWSVVPGPEVDDVMIQNATSSPPPRMWWKCFKPWFSSLVPTLLSAGDDGLCPHPLLRGSAAGAGGLYSRAYKHLSGPRPRHALNHRTRTADKITCLLAPECLGRSSEDRFGWCGAVLCLMDALAGARPGHKTHVSICSRPQ